MDINISVPVIPYSIYPWQQEIWEQIQSMQRQNRLPHALLISGGTGMGISSFSRNIASSLLCENPSETGEFCQQCKSCRMLIAETHPELLVITPLEDSKSIKVEQIRELTEFTHLQSQFTQRKVVIIDPAEVMNRNAANSLLKTLEEPIGNALIMLVTHYPSFLPITVRSRCQKFRMSASSMHIKKWLDGKYPEDLIEAMANSGRGPLTFSEDTDSDQVQILREDLILDLENMLYAQQDPIKTAANWAGKKDTELLFWLRSLLEDMVKVKMADNSVNLVNKDFYERSLKLTEHFEVSKIFNLLDKVSEFHWLTTTNSNLKSVTMYEEFTISWTSNR